MKRLILLPLLLAFTFANASEYIIDDAHSHVGFSIKHLMISNVKGEFKSFDADIDFDTKSKTFNSLKATVDINSIDTGIKKRDAHLLSPDFFNAAKYQTMQFEATNISKDKIVGNLSMHGITKEIVLTPTIHGVVKIKGTNKVGFTLTGEIDRKEFGLTWNKLIEGGGLTVGDTVKIEVDIEAMEM